MNVLHRMFVFVSAGVLLVAVAASATAKPYTALLAPLTTDLKARLALLKPQKDLESRIKKELVQVALVQLRQPSKTVDGDLKILTSVARKIELAYGANDPELIAALDAFVVRVSADRDSATGRLPTVVNAQSEADARDHLDAATAAILRVVQRPADLDTVKLRAGVLRDAAKSVASANAKIKSASGCSPRTFGSIRMALDGVPERPTFGNATLTTSNASGDVVNVLLQGYFYDRTAADPYERGAWDVSIGAAFQGVGTYTVGSGAGFGRVEHGVAWIADSGTVEVTSYDPVKKRIAGSFSGTLRNLSTNATVEVTSGFFTFCAWNDGRVSKD